MEKTQTRKIDSGIPCPPSQRVAGKPYATLARQMKVGQSVLFENYREAIKLQVAVRRIGHSTKMRTIGRTGWRIWKGVKIVPTNA